MGHPTVFLPANFHPATPKILPSPCVLVDLFCHVAILCDALQCRRARMRCACECVCVCMLASAHTYVLVGQHVFMCVCLCSACLWLPFCINFVLVCVCVLSLFLAPPAPLFSFVLFLFLSHFSFILHACMRKWLFSRPFVPEKCLLSENAIYPKKIYDKGSLGFLVKPGNRARQTDLRHKEPRTSRGHRKVDTQRRAHSNR